MSMPRQHFIKCPCCWKRFHLSQTKWIAEHHELKDDYFIDDEGDKIEQKRFHPERFTTDCRAIDDKNMPCQRDFACPHCHMEMPDRYFDCEPMYVTLVGTKGSGKTFFLTALHHRLQQNPFEEDYELEGVSYIAGLYASKNIDLETNVKRLFRSTAPVDTFVTLDGTTVGNHAKKVSFPNADSDRESYVALPFTHVLESEGKKHALCLYDCQGTLFTKRGGIEEADSIFMQAILNSDVLFFLYDPTQNENCVMEYTEKYGRHIYRDGKINVKELLGMEKAILNPESDIDEQSHLVFGAMANYIRNFAQDRLDQNDRYARHICIIVTKCDAWEKCLRETQGHLRELPKDDVIVAVSKEVENWIKRHDPAFTTAVRSFASHYTYIPVSAAGRQVTKDAEGDEGYDIGVEPLNPRWVDVPFLCALYPPNQ